jgi:AcrR family transcriptional regulator
MSETDELRPPLQERTRLAWQRILDEGLALLEEDGFDGLTIAALCERAGVTPPTIYARAPSKEALLRALYDHALERISRSDELDPADERWQQLPPEQVIAQAVTVLFRIWIDNASLMRAIVRHSSTDPVTLRRGSEASIDAARRFRRVLTARPDVVGGADPARSADACFRIVYAALVQRVMFGEAFESDLPLTDEQLRTTLIGLVSGYLSHPEEERCPRAVS